MALFVAFVLSLLALYCGALAFTGTAVGAENQSQPSPVRALAKPCKTVPAAKWNHLVRTERRIDGTSRKLRRSPVCVATYKQLKRHVAKRRVQIERRLETDVRFAIAKAFDPIGRTSEALRVAYCESTHNRFATNGQFRGLFQLGAHHWHRLDGKPYSHAYANARAAAEIVAADGGFRQWECKP